MTSAAESEALVLDTNVVSELMRPAPQAQVVGWARQQPAATLFTTAVTVAEVRFGIARLPRGRRRDLLLAAADDVFGLFSDRVLPFDSEAAPRYAEVVAGRERAGTPISGFDAQVAAICLARGAVLAARNIPDFEGVGLTVLDPWRHPA